MSSSWQLLKLTTLLLALCGTGEAQYKTAGIKTRQPIPASGNLLLSSNGTSEFNQTQFNSQTQYSNYGSYSNFVPAETYQGGEAYSGHYVQSMNQATRAPQILDETALFINKTRSAMASGICYKEVPTASLLHGSRENAVGNGTSPDLSQIQVCCEGYERNPHIYRRCEPICKDDCPNGICTAPNTCVCMPKHVRTDEGKCISTCPLGCGNGVCDDQNECRCREGYSLDPVSRKYCQPQCNPGCANGRCVAPNKCDCLLGYRRAGDGSCAPVCDQCENGKCVAPGQCDCRTGYAKVVGRCEPVCEQPCRNGGRCVAPNTCECAPGYDWDQKSGQCVPHCDMPCLNGVCIGQNQCECKPGYILDEHQRNICQAHCPQGCPNGYCSAPNFCICRPGFIKSGIKGRQSCQPV
ncbi:von Willebrand factor D and EGF domain-containing protein [Drosophila grimshawi]|uniref:GH10607 n=1 Tax=Drosophila grimshawi TaxID=7222 RepID=B4JD63_DROGR|nr:von Willebrand factor D and EGF domain-containing protein [Drosophila grimshawi]EDW03236.1 GH10607 [Drosophila grimshawi]